MVQHTHKNRIWLASLVLMTLITLALSACAQTTSVPGDLLPGDEGLFSYPYPYPYPVPYPYTDPYPPAVDRDEVPRPQPGKIEKIITPEVIEDNKGNPRNRSNVTIDGSGVVEMKESPSGYGLRIVGTMPTPCHELHADVQGPDVDGKINVAVYSTVEPGIICIQSIGSFDETFALETYEPTQHVVLVNGEPAGSLYQ